MATHIGSIRTSTISKVAKQQFYAELQWGDMVFCQGNYPISKGIGLITKSPLSHVLMAWLPGGATQWLTLEATASRGVHVGRLSDYVDSYDGDLVVARRYVKPDNEPARLLRDAEKIGGLNALFEVLEEAYDWQQEVCIAAHKLLRCLPVVKPAKEYYCSGLMYHASKGQGWPLQMPGPNLPTPEDIWTDPTVVPQYAYCK